MRAFTPAAPPSVPTPRKSTFSRDLLKAALAVALVASAILVPLHPAFAMLLALAGSVALCRIVSQHVQRVMLVVSTAVLLLVMGAFDQQRSLSVQRAASPDGARVAWLIGVDDALHVFVEPLPLRALVGVSRDAEGKLDRDIERARIIWSRDSQGFLVVGTPRSQGLWTTSRLAWGDERVLGKWDAATPWRWQPLPAWSARAPDWLGEIASKAWQEPLALAQPIMPKRMGKWPSSSHASSPAAPSASRSMSAGVFPYSNVNGLRVVETSGRAKAVLLGRPRWDMLWAEGRLINGEHVLAQQDRATLEWSVLEPWARHTPRWLRALQDDDEDELEFDVRSDDKERMCNCTP